MTASEFTCKLQIKRDASVLPDVETLTVFIDDNEAYQLEKDQLKATFQKPGTVKIKITDGTSNLLENKMTAYDKNVVLLSIETKPSGFLGSIMGARSKLALTQVSRKSYVPCDQGPPREVINQIWLGHAKDKNLFFDFMAERDAYWSEANEEAEGTPAHIALSAFAEAMGEKWYDHDFSEYAFADGDGLLEEKFRGQSWINFWAPMVREATDPTVISRANFCIAMVVDVDPNFGISRQINHPKDFKNDNLEITYMGEFKHPSH